MVQGTVMPPHLHRCRRKGKIAGIRKLERKAPAPRMFAERVPMMDRRVQGAASRNGCRHYGQPVIAVCFEVAGQILTQSVEQGIRVCVLL